MNLNIENKIGNFQPVIFTQDLHIGYKKETIVPEINLKLHKGESLALVGVNGSGKSTLLKSIVGLLAPIKGQIQVLGSDPGKTPKQIAYLSQFHNSGIILPLRSVDVVRMGRFANHGLLGKMDSLDEKLIQESMERMGISYLADTTLRSLSGGQQQRVYIAKVLARKADLIILDEPTAGLDAGGQNLFQQAMQDELCRGASLVVATHDIQDALDCDQTMLLARKVIALGRGKEVITTEALLEAFGIVFTLNNQEQQVTILEREHAHEKCDDHNY